MKSLSTLSELLASAGTVVAAMGCAVCFPALGAIAAALGLGFLSAYEGVLITRILPLLAAAALLLGLLNWWRHRVHWRGLLSLLGPLMVLAALYPFWQYAWSRGLFYGGLLVMLAIAVWDFVQPPRPAPCRR